MKAPEKATDKAPAKETAIKRQRGQQATRMGIHCDGRWKAMIEPVLTGTRSQLAPK